MKTISIISFISILLFVPNIEAQNIAPLKLGNIWVYEQPTTIGRITIVDTNIVINSIPYFEFSIESNYGGETDSHYVRLREDGFYVYLNKFDSTESIYYKKNAVIGDTWTVGTLVYSIEDTFVANVFGEQTTIKFLLADDGLIYRQEYWTEKFGKLGSQDFGGVLDDLQGCVIDGTAYGDTSFIIVTVEDEFETPNSFYLSQNYPNPFNPTTKIKYFIPYVETRHASSLQTVTLKVYDLLGREVATLVNEEKPAGEYEVEFNAANLPSGVYFYQLKAGELAQTMKMVYLK
jgi:Secretion system C-terminal sorting domain